MRLRRLALATLSLFGAATLTACAETPTDAIRIGTIDANQREWHVFQELAQENGFIIEIVTYGDYTTPNDALASGELDLNNFQHLSYLGGYNVRADEDLVPLASTAIYPLGLYQDGVAELANIEGEDVYIPNDAVNQARALNLLADADLITLRPGAPAHPAPVDILAAESEVTVHPVGQGDVLSAYREDSPAVIPSTQLDRVGLNATQALAADDPTDIASEPYTYVWATTPENVGDERLNELVDLWQHPEVSEAVIESAHGAAVPVDKPQEELARILEQEENFFAG